MRRVASPVVRTACSPLLLTVRPAPAGASRTRRFLLATFARHVPFERRSCAHVHAPTRRHHPAVARDRRRRARSSVVSPTEIATLLRGKHKPIWAPHVDTGDHVIVVNASKLAVSPPQGEATSCTTGTPATPAASGPRPSSTCSTRDPEKVVRLAVKRMLPKGPLGRGMLKKLKIHAGPTHPAPRAAARGPAAARALPRATPAD